MAYLPPQPDFPEITDSYGERAVNPRIAGFPSR
jgi:hypothetical protein